jgi:competence protein ComEA
MTTFRSLLAAVLLALALVGSAFAAGKLDINRATAAELAAAMNGIGAAKAEAIVAYRTENGPFKSIDQLAEVKGIGLKTIEKNRGLIEVGSAKPAAAATPAAPSATP